MTFFAFIPPAARAARRSILLIGLLIAFLAVPALTQVGPGVSEAIAGGLIAPKKVCPDHAADGGSAEMAKARRAMVCLVNYARRKKGLKRYKVNRSLNWSAKRKSKDILRCGFSHDACGRGFDYWIRRSGYLKGAGGWSIGENIAWGSGPLGNVRVTFKGWMKSKSHRAAILKRAFRDIGVGVVKGEMEGYAGSRVWTLHFGVAR